MRFQGGGRSGRKREDILVAARTLFIASGYAGTGMDALAKLAAVSTATLYAYFPSKSAPFRSVVEETVADLGEAVQATAVPTTGSARERLNTFALAYGRFYSDPLSRAVFRLVTGGRGEIVDLADHFQERSREGLGGVAVEIIRTLAAEGLLKVEQPAWAAGQLLGMVEHATLVLGLVRGDAAEAARPLEVICADAVETFLARYGV